MTGSNNYGKNRRKAFCALILVQVILLLIGCVFYGQERPGLDYEENDLYLARNDIPAQKGFYVDESYDGIGLRISGPVMFLDRGLYRADVSYHIENEQEFQAYSRVIAVPSGEELSFPLSERIEEQYSILCDKTPLRSYQPEVSYRFHVRADRSPLALICALGERPETEYTAEELSGDESESDSVTWISVRSIEVTYLRAASVLRFLLIWSFLFASLDLVLFYCFVGRRLPRLLRDKKKRQVLGSLAVIFALSEIPMLLPYIPKGGDLDYHLVRLGAIAQGLSDGQFPVRIQPIWNNGYGDAAGVMYGDILLYIPALIYLAGFTIDFAYKLYVFLISLGTTAFCYLCGREIFGRRKTAVIMTAFYVLSPYRLCDVYARAAVGEYTALMFLPVIVMGMHGLYSSHSVSDSSRNPGRKWILLGLGFTGVVTSHALSIIMVTVFLVLFALLEYKRTFSKTVLPGIMKAAGLSLLLSVYFLVPFIDYYLHVPMRVTDPDSVGIYSSSSISLPQYYAIPLEREPYGVGPLFLLVLVFGLFLYFRRPVGKRSHAVRTLLIMNAVSIWLASNYFPYALVNRYAHRIYKTALECIQFPWRWNTLASILCFLLIGWELSELCGMTVKQKRVQAVFILAACAIAVQSYVYTDVLCRESRGYDYMNVSVTNAWGWAYEIAREYAPRGLDTMEVVYPTEVSGSDNIEIVDAVREAQRFDVHVRNISANDGELVLPVFAYKGYRAKLPDGTGIPVEAGDYFKLQVTVPANTEWDGLQVFFEEPAIWRGAELISAATMLILLFYLGYCSMRSAGSE